ncbi:MAG: hypothetical protein SAMD01599839_12600 [Rectinema sp.]
MTVQSSAEQWCTWCVEFTEDKQNEILQIRALVFLCDDFANYALDLDERFRSRFGARAKEALRQASSLVEKCLTNPAVEEFLVGLAWFELHINADKEKAAYWIALFEKRGTSIHHYAYWFVNYYSEVKQALSDGV